MKRVRITVAPFNYSSGRNVTAVIRQTGTYPVGEGDGEILPEIAQAAVDQGHAEWFDPKRAKSGTTNRRRSSSPRKTATRKSDDAANAGQSDRMGRAGVVADGDAPDQRPDDAAE